MPQQSLAARAVMALRLTIGFYALALGIVAALLGAVYAEVAASAATNLVDARFPRAERGAGLSGAPPRATATSSSRISARVWRALRQPRSTNA